MKDPLVTVLMSVYNGEKYLAEAVDSILSQTYRDFEFIIIDDGSTDTSAEIISSYSDPRIRLIKNETNIGLTRSLNKGITLARGKYIARMDADDISLPERLEKQVGFMETNDDIAVCGAKGILIDSEGNDIGRIEPTAYLSNEIKEKLLVMNQFIHSAVVLRKSILVQVGCYDGSIKYAQDYKLWVDILASGLLLYNLQTVLIKHRMHNEKTSLVKSDMQEDYACGIIKNGFKKIYNLSFSKKDISLMRKIMFYNDNSLSPKTVHRIKKKFSNFI